MEHRKRDNFITFILVILIIIIFFSTIYFCLDVFGIIRVPAKYSIASLFYSQIEVIATGGENLTENIVPDEIIKDTFSNNKIKETSTDEIIEVENQDVENPLYELEKLEEERNVIFNESKNLEELVSAEDFYYNQLDEYGKIIYNELYKNIDKLKTGTYTAEFDTTFNDLLHQENGSEVLNNSFQLAINALTFDNPDLFYIDITKINLITEITTRAFSTTYRISIGGNGRSYLADEFIDENNVSNAINNVNLAKDDIINQTGDDTVENLKIIHDYLIDTIEYDANVGRNVYNIYGALVDKRAVCEGYARTYKAILDDMGIPCIIACGLARNSNGETESHAWNYVKIDENWYAIDVTWDDPVIIGNGNITDDIKYHYFLNGSNQFFEDHFEDGNIAGEYNFKYPILSETNY